MVIILIGTMQLAGISLGEEAETQFMQAEPAAAPGRPPEERGAAELPAAQQAAAPAAQAGPRGERAAAGAAGAADAASQAVEKVVEKEVAVEKIVTRAPAAAATAAPPAAAEEMLTMVPPPLSFMMLAAACAPVHTAFRFRLS